MNMTYRFLTYILLLTLVWLPTAAFAADPATLVEGANLFSYQAPSGWVLKSTPNAPYKIACDIKDGNVAASINVETDTKPGSLDEWTQNSLAKNKEQFSKYNFQVKDQKPFVTTSGAKGVRIVITLTAGANNMQLVDYNFEGSSNAKIVVTCTCLAQEGDHYAAIFDAALKTFTPK